MNKSVSIRDLSLSFGAVTVLKDLNLDIYDGEFLVLLGSSGCGKSTLLNCIAGLLEPTDGQIFIKDRNVTWEEPKDRGIGMVFQSYALYPQMTVEKNLSFGLQVAKVPKEEIDRRVKRAAGILQIEPLLKRKPAELSGGQRQRVAIGRALVRDVDVFLFDEPLSNLDAKLRVEMRTEMKLMHQRLKTTTVYVTHDQIEAMTLGDKVAVMKDGIIQQFGTPQQIYNDPANQFVASFIGSPPMNFIPVRLTQQEGRLLAVLDSGQARCELPLGVADGELEGRELILGIRPEQIALGDAEGNGLPGIRAEVQVTEPTGPDLLVFVTLNQTKVCCRLAPDVACRVGVTLNLQFDPARVLLFDADSGERIRLASTDATAKDNVAHFKGR